MATTLIQKQSELVSLCAELREEDVLGLDTEFLRVRTYFPRLCLIQIATADRVACIDPLALDELSPLLELLLDPNIVKVLHAARQDLEVLYPLSERVPGPVFDTQIAASLCGSGDQPSYAALVREMVGVDLAKAHTRTDWCARPLSAAQIRYAEDDVRYLVELYQGLRDRLIKLSRLEWLQEELALFTDASLFLVEADEAHQRVRGRGSLSPLEQNRLQDLASWREVTAQQDDLPREWVLRDADLVALARRDPLDRNEFFQFIESDSRRRRYADSVLQRLGEFRNRKPSTEATIQVKANVKLTSQQRRQCDELMGLVREAAEQMGIAAGLLGTRKQVERLVRGDHGAALLTGWRAEVIGHRLQEQIKRMENSGT